MTSIKVDVGARRRDWTLPLCFLAALTEGFDIQSMGVAAPQLAPALAIGRDQLGPVFSSSVLGLLIGAVLLGRVADRIGRKRTLIFSLAVYGVFSALTSFAWDFSSLLAIRLIAGLGLGGAMPNFIALSAEAVADRRRVRVVTLLAAGMPLGAAIAGMIAAGSEWRNIFYAGGAAPLVLALTMAFHLPESRGFVLAKQSATMTEPRAADFVGVLFGARRATTTLLLWLAFFAALLVLYLLLNWLPILLTARGLSRSGANLASVLFNLAGALGTLTLAALFESERRSRTIVIWYAAIGAALIALAFADGGMTSALTTSFAAGFFVSSAPLALYGMAPEFFPIISRATGVGASVAVGRLGAILGPLLAAALLSAGLGVRGVLLALLPLAGLAAIATLALLTRPRLAD